MGCDKVAARCTWVKEVAVFPLLRANIDTARVELVTRPGTGVPSLDSRDNTQVTRLGLDVSLANVSAVTGVRGLSSCARRLEGFRKAVAYSPPIVSTNLSLSAIDSKARLVGDVNDGV